MTVEHVTQSDQLTAANYGMANFRGGDPEVAEDLGIPFSPEELTRQMHSGALMAELAGVSIEAEPTPAELARQKAHEIYVKINHVQAVRIPDANAAQKASNAVHVTQLKRLIEPTRFQA